MTFATVVLTAPPPPVIPPCSGMAVAKLFFDEMGGATCP